MALEEAEENARRAVELAEAAKADAERVRDRKIKAASAWRQSVGAVELTTALRTAAETREMLAAAEQVISTSIHNNACSHAKTCCLCVAYSEAVPVLCTVM